MRHHTFPISFPRTSIRRKISIRNNIDLFFRETCIKFSIFIFLAAFCPLSPLRAQNLNAAAATKEAGTPFIRNYPPGEYRADGQNWAIVQDQRGLMYFGNSDGVLEYDGVSWRLIETINKTVVRSLAVDENNRVYVGAYGEIGYLAPDTIGQLQYISLLPYLEEKYHDFSDVWQTVVTSQGVYFATQKYLFRWANQQMRVWEAPTLYLLCASVNDQIYVRQWKKGLMQMVSDSLTLAPGGEQFDKKRISQLLPYPGRNKNHLLVCTQTEGLFLYDGLSAAPFPTAFDERLKKARLYKSARLPNGGYAFSTMQDGVFIMDEKGNLLHHLNKATGLQNNTAWSLCPDRQGGLWIGMDAGISRAEISAPLTHFTGLEGVEGSIFDIIRHQGVLHIATSTGIYFLDEASGPPGSFKPVSGIPPQCWKLLSAGGSLFGGTFQGVYEVRGGQAYLANRGYVFYLCRSRQDTNRIFMGLQGGIGSLYYAEGQWRQEGLIDGIAEEIRDILETPDGKLWLTTRYQGLLRVDFPEGFTLQPTITRFDTLQGLPAGDRNVAFATREGLRFATPRGIYRFDEVKGRFIEDPGLIKGFPNGQGPIFSVAQDRRENLWLLVPEANSGMALRQADGSYAWDESPLLRISDADLNVAYPDPLHENLTWFGGNERLIQYDASVPKNNALDFSTFIRQVIVNGDSLVYGGTAGESIAIIPELAYANNSLRFSFAAPCYDDESKNEYQYFLEGYDKGWSNWSPESRKDYTNLPAGKYRFQVRAKSIYRQVGEPAVYEFSILPPFYRTWWAYALYTLLFLGVLYALRQQEVKRLNAKHLREMKLLEYDKLKELDQLKSRFFADVSHEFRTPLTLILGPLENLISGTFKGDVRQDYRLMRRSARRLLRLINQLLDLSKVEAGKMMLEASYGDVIPFIRRNFHAFESLAKHKGINQRFETEIDAARLYFDPDKLEQVLSNILSNAFKFTPEGGTVSVKIKSEGTEAAARFLQVAIADTGTGIPAEQLPHVFDRFYSPPLHSPVGGKPRTSPPASGGATGIGLALAKELVELHHGQIRIASTVGEGAQFTILLPFGKAHLRDEEIVEREPGRPLTVKETGLAPDTEEIEIAGEPLPGVAVFADTVEEGDENMVLLVEDNPDMRAFIRAQLANEYKVVEAADGQQGLEKAIELTPDLIISDVMMPVMDGLQLCDTLKNDERTSHIPIILLTAKADVESRLEGLERGADAYLAKPFNREELLVRARKLLELRRQLRKRYASLKPPAPAEDKGLQMEDAFLLKIRQLVELQISDINLDMGQLSQALGMSRSQVYRKVKALTGQSPSVFVRAIRLERAKELLQSTDMNVTEVAYEVGFSTPAYFSDAFLEAFGVRPSDLRR
ncbi:MAG: response regulator [Lewinellaceae bacterium]|nr:response regulator [Lewinellaceae bacterium]